MPRRDRCYLITCEHGGNRIPPRYTKRFAAHRAALNSHRGWDPGALALARRLAKTLDAALIVSTTSRLLVDLNRSEHHREVFSTITRALPSAQRNRILDDHYRPYRGAVMAEADALTNTGARLLHVSAHSFVPVLNGQRRRADIALLYDPRRAHEADFCASWSAALAAALPELQIRRNYPYRGSADGLTTALRRRYRADDYLGIEIEINQRLIAAQRRYRQVSNAICATLAALAPPGTRWVDHSSGET